MIEQTKEELTKYIFGEDRNAQFNKGYAKGKADAIDECIQTIEKSKTLFDNSTRWTMSEKCGLQNMLRQLKEKNDE